MENIDLPEMPESPAPNMKLISFSVPVNLLEDAKALAAADGWKEAEFHRMVWALGVAFYADKSLNRINSRQPTEGKNDEQATE